MVTKIIIIKKGYGASRRGYKKGGKRWKKKKGARYGTARKPYRNFKR